MTGQILLALVGLFSGAVIASGVVAFMISPADRAPICGDHKDGGTGETL